MSKIIAPEDLLGLPSVPCVSRARKFILPIPKAHGDPLVFPNGHAKAGELLTDSAGEPLQGRGMVFHNAVDRVEQAVRSDGEGVVVLNEVPEKGAVALVALIAFFGGDPSKMTLEEGRAFLQAARALGYADQYNSDKAFVAAKMVPIGHGEGFGAFKRDAGVCDAFLMREAGSFQGPAGEPQPFLAGDVIVRQSRPAGGFIHAKVDGAVFARTYSDPGGGPVGFDAA